MPCDTINLESMTFVCLQDYLKYSTKAGTDTVELEVSITDLMCVIKEI